MDKIDEGFKQRVFAIVAQIPQGKVMTYGQIAALAGSPFAARVVGGVAHFGDPNLPWERVVNKSGGLASGYPGGKVGHKQMLEQQGYVVSDDFTVNVGELLWRP